LDDATRIEQLLDGQESEIDEDMILGDFDPSFSTFTGLQLYRQTDAGEEVLMYDFMAAKAMPENSIRGIRNAIQIGSGDLLVD
jgi:hypothetical protein